MIRSVAGQQEAYDNFIEWLLESEAQEAYEEYVGRKQRECLTESKKILVGGKAYKVLKFVSSYDSTPLASEKPEMEGKNRFKDWQNILSSFKFVDTPIGRVFMNADELSDHFQPKENGEIGWRKTGIGFVIMTLQNPQEIWVNKRREVLSFVYVRQFRVYLKEGATDMVQIAVVSGDTKALKTYYSEKNEPDSLYKKRMGCLIYKR